MHGNLLPLLSTEITLCWHPSYMCCYVYFTASADVLSCSENIEQHTELQ
jgi:hypothetical protein